MGFDLKKCLERDNGVAMARRGRITLLCEHPAFTNMWFVGEHGEGRGYWNWIGSSVTIYCLSEIENLPDPPRRVKVREAVGRSLGPFECVELEREVAQAIYDQLGDLEIELKGA